eukprot:gene35032-47071_t
MTTLAESCSTRREGEQLMRIIGVFTAALLVTACGGEAGDSGGPVLPLGVYVCDSTQMIGGMVMPQPEPVFMFGVTGPGRYRAFDGGSGRFGITDGILTMTSGPLEGTRYRQDSETYFQPIDDDGQPSGIRCVHSATKDIDQPW